MSEKPTQAGTLEALLHSARTQAGLTSAQAMRRLRHRLRQKVNRWSGALVETWEEGAADLEPWLLVEYLQALGAPAETWLELLESFQSESAVGAAKRSGKGFRNLLEQISEDQRAALISVLCGWVRAEAEMARVVPRMDHVSTHFIDFLLTQLGSPREGDPEPSEEKPRLETSACASA